MFAIIVVLAQSDHRLDEEDKHYHQHNDDEDHEDQLDDGICVSHYDSP